MHEHDAVSEVETRHRPAHQGAVAQPSAAAPAGGLAGLQRSVGNRAVVSLLQAGQAKLEVGAVDDPHEREADAVARSVVEALRAGSSAPVPTDADGVQRVARRISAVQRRAEVGAAGGEVAGETESAITRARRSGGTPLAPEARGRFEAAFGGADLSQVRLHAGAEAAALNERVSAQAFTVGSDVFFRHGVPDVSSPSGQELLAHELTHTIQQSGGQS